MDGEPPLLGRVGRPHRLDAREHALACLARSDALSDRRRTGVERLDLAELLDEGGLVVRHAA
jgi:hypothetical protein